MYRNGEGTYGKNWNSVSSRLTLGVVSIRGLVIDTLWWHLVRSDLGQFSDHCWSCWPTLKSSTWSLHQSQKMFFSFFQFNKSSLSTHVAQAFRAPAVGFITGPHCWWSATPGQAGGTHRFLLHPCYGDSGRSQAVSPQEQCILHS